MIIISRSCGYNYQGDNFEREKAMGSEKDEKRDKKHKSEKHRDKKEDEYERMKKLEKKRKKEMEEEEMKKNYFGYTNGLYFLPFL